MFKNRIRLPFYLSKPQFPVEKNVFRKADGTSKLLSAIIRNTYQGKTDQLPEDWHKKLVVALSHDEVTIEDNRLLTDVVLDGDYGIDWQDFLDHPVAQATFSIQVTPFNASNSNCQSCAEITQLDLVDDTTEDVWQEGTTNEFPDIITANDEICCYPYTIEIMSFNTLYFDSVTVDQDGVVTATVKATVPTLSNVLVATYRVTCENGGYDEANIYANIEGTSTECLPVTELEIEQLPSDTNLYVSWTEPGVVPSGGYDWALYLSSDLVTSVQSGNTTADNLTLNGAALLPGQSYTFVVISNCGEGDTSTPVSTTFNWAERIAETCGSFLVTYLPSASEGSQSVSYMDCFGVVQNHTFVGAGQITVCMLITDGTEIPVFFAASTEDITYTYLDLC